VEEEKAYENTQSTQETTPGVKTQIVENEVQQVAENLEKLSVSEPVAIIPK
jgi:hypothetical protein